LIFFLAVAMGAMYEFLFIVSVALFAITGFLTWAHYKQNERLRLIGKVANVGITIIAFINIFACDLTYDY
jgi:hypothetical protein